MQKKTVSLPESYRILKNFGMFFSLDNLGIAPFPTEIAYLAHGNQIYLSCRSPKTHELRVHPIQASKHPWIRLTKKPDQKILHTPVSISLSEEQLEQHRSVNQRMNIDNEFVQDLRPFYALKLPISGQLLFIVTEKGKDRIVRNIAMSTLHQHSEFYLVSRHHTDGSTSRLLTFSRDGWDTTDRQIITVDKLHQIKMSQLPFPKKLPSDQTVPFMKLQITKNQKVVKEKTISIRYQKDYRPVKEYPIEDEPTHEVKAYFHPTMNSFEKAKLNEMVILSDKLSQTITEELKAVKLEKLQNTRKAFSYMTLLEYGNTQTFKVYLKKRANKTDIYLQDRKTKKSAKLSSDVARQVLKRLDDQSY